MTEFRKKNALQITRLVRLADEIPKILATFRKIT